MNNISITPDEKTIAAQKAMHTSLTTLREELDDFVAGRYRTLAFNSLDVVELWASKAVLEDQWHRENPSTATMD